MSDMGLYNYYYTICGFFIISFLLLARYCYNIWKIFGKFPILHLFPYLIYGHLTRKLPKDIPFNSVAFRVIIESCQRYYKEGICVSYLSRPIVVIFGEEAVKTLFNEKIAAEKPFEYKTGIELLGEGLVISNGERWRKHRKLINPSFHLGMLKDRVPLFNNHALALIKDLESMNGRPSSDPLNFIKSHYLNALFESVFGLKQNEENKIANLKYLNIIDNLTSMVVYRYANPWYKWKFLKHILPSSKKYFQVCEELHSFAKKVLSEMEKLISSNELSQSEHFSNNFQKSFTYLLFQQHLKDSSFTLEDLQAEITTFMFAGYDTVSYTTLWCLYVLGLYPEVQEKAFNEVSSATHNYVSYEDSCEFSYLEAVIMETLRLYPTVPFVGRETTQEVQFGKYKLPKNTHIGIGIYLYHRNPDIFPNPEKFDPERFLGNGVKNNLLIPFAEGSRSCIGKRYAMIELKIFLAHILRNFKIKSLDKIEDVNFCWNVVLATVKPLRFNITPRSTNTDTNSN